MIQLYYLLYKFINDDILCIVKISDILEVQLEYTEKFKSDYEKFKSDYEKFKSDYEKYYLIERQIKLKYKEKELERQVFTLDNNDRIINNLVLIL
jgi:hypothetical protein